MSSPNEPKAEPDLALDEAPESPETSLSCTSAEEHANSGRRLAFILNPSAGGGRALQVKDLLERQLRRCFHDDQWKIYETTARGDGTLLAAKAVEEDFNVVVSIGGDGTHNEVLNGLIDRENKKADVVMALLPVGTGGDLQRTIGTKDFSVSQLIDLIIHPNRYNAQPQKIDIASLEATALPQEDGSPPPTATVQRYFINTSSCGISGAVCSGANSGTKALGGFVTFFYHTCKETLRWRNRLLHWHFDDNEEGDSGNIYQIVMANGKYFGGGMSVAPDAELDDGLFDVMIFKDIGVTDVSLLPRVYRGTHVDQQKIFCVRAKKVTIDVDPEEKDPLVLIEADGELGGCLPASWEILPGQISLLYPLKGTEPPSLSPRSISPRNILSRRKSTSST